MLLRVLSTIVALALVILALPVVLLIALWRGDEEWPTDEEAGVATVAWLEDEFL